MGLGFGGEVARFYQRYRRGYPPAVFDALVEAFGLTPEDTVVDLGCGTGQLTLPIAARVRAVVGVDPEPDMLELARQAARDQLFGNVGWLLGADTDVPALAALLGDGRVGAVTIGQALHWMDHDTLFPRLRPLLRPGGGVAVVTNGTPLWLQDTAWSRALRGCLEQWRGAELSQPCGTDAASQRRYADSLVAAGYDVEQRTVDYTDEIDLDDLVGGVYSALSRDALPAPEQRTEFATRIRDALHPETRFPESVRVTVLAGRRR
ncbi:class I SAM-dependent methyltransferase [Micromonospora sp. WMMD1082]|uniref:class I SAM-dependent methyltransferase n=1 Tax=Micromonospora sp. WMMD1082 TaxID=3016104 RepID=UPI00241720CC|nr:class I SAM-dependent methyltransferase [Micromonospora sp. WMMD1082]MDG4798006.1 methyltransferase domain-containing protein [Micromonospora sp. WMMD1082]